MFPAILRETQEGTPAAAIAKGVHDCVARATVEACCSLSAEAGITRVVLSGGVFQNRLLTELIYNSLTVRGLQVFTHRLVPPNDGCIALGQAAIAGWQIRSGN
jgi:hydrogenase maturation protein HypF